MHGLIFDLSLPFRQVQPGSCVPAIARTPVLLARSFYSSRFQFSLVWPGETPGRKAYALQLIAIAVAILSCLVHAHEELRNR